MRTAVGVRFSMAEVSFTECPSMSRSINTTLNVGSFAATQRCRAAPTVERRSARGMLNVAIFVIKPSARRACPSMEMSISGQYSLSLRYAKRRAPEAHRQTEVILPPTLDRYIVLEWDAYPPVGVILPLPDCFGGNSYRSAVAFIRAQRRR